MDRLRGSRDTENSPLAGQEAQSEGTNKEGIMLVLGRERYETIVIGDNVTVTIVDIKGGTVRLGVEAPKEVPVHRLEVFDAIRRLEVA